MATTSALLEAAYTNVSLLADAAWAPCSLGPMGVPLTGTPVDPSACVASTCGVRTGVSFRRANQDLWLRCVNLDRYIRENQCISLKNNGNTVSGSLSSMNSGQNSGWYQYKVPVVGKEDESAGDKRPRTVKDTIPLSRLASYGGQASYNEERERLYTADDVIYEGPPIHPMDSQIPDEPWLLSAVEEVFKRLTVLPERTPRLQRKYDEYSGKNSQGISRYSSSELLQDLSPQMRHQNGSIGRDEIQPNSLQHSKSEPHLSNLQRYKLANHEEVRLQMKIRAPAVQDLWSKINNQVRLGQSFPQLQIQKARQVNHYTHQLNQHQQMMPSSGRLSRHRSLSRFPVLQMQNMAIPKLNAEVPEFYPKTNSGPPFGLLLGAGSGCSDCGGMNLGNAVTILMPPAANELAYQDELFPYRGERDITHHHKLQTMDHVAAILARPPANGAAQQSRSNNPWFLPTTNSTGKTSATGLLQPVPPPVSLPPPALPPPHKSLKATRHSTRNGKMQFQSTPIPVYQRPPEFYTQQNEAATNGNGTAGSIGTRRRTGGTGVDFSNLILLTRGGKGHNRQSTTSAPSTPLKTVSTSADIKSQSNRPITSDGDQNSTELTPTLNALEVPPAQMSQSAEDVFQWLNAAFGLNKSKTLQQVGDGQTTQTAALDLAVASYPPRASADNLTDEAGTRRRLYRDVLARATCSASGEETTVTPINTTPVPPASSGDKLDLLEEEAVLQYHSSEDSLNERVQGQVQRRLDGEAPMMTPTPLSSTTTSTITSTMTTSTSATLTATTSNTTTSTMTVPATAEYTSSIGTTQSTAQSPTKQRRFKDQCGCKTSTATGTPPPPPPVLVPPGDEVQSPRRRLYRDVLAHRHAGPSTEPSGPVSGPRDSASWSDVLKRLEEQALMEYRLSDDVACGSRETSLRVSEEALSRRYQDLERQALMQYLRGSSSNSEVQASEGDPSNDRSQRGRCSINSRSGTFTNRIEEDVMVNLKLLQREKSRASTSKFHPNRTYNLQDNQSEKRVYRKQLTKKSPQPQEVQLQQQLGHNTISSFVQMPAQQLPQVHLQMNNAKIGQPTVNQQLLQEQLALLHLNQQATQPALEQLSPFHQLPQKVTPKPPQAEFCLHAQQNYQQVCQQPPPQSTSQQPLSQLQLIELQQRLSHPGLSTQQVVELQTLYQHQTFTTPELEFLQYHKILKKQYSQKTAKAPKVPLQKPTHRRQHSQPKIQQLEYQDIQNLELQQQRMAGQNVPLMLSLPQIVTPQSPLVEMQNRWQQQLNSYSCTTSPTPQCGGPLLDPHGDLALGGAPPPGQLQARPADPTASLQVMDTTSCASLISNPILTVEEFSDPRNVVRQTLPKTDMHSSHVASDSVDPCPETSNLLEAPDRNERKIGNKKKKQVNNNEWKNAQKKSKNRPSVKILNEGRTRGRRGKEKQGTGASFVRSVGESDGRDLDILKNEIRQLRPL